MCVFFKYVNDGVQYHFIRTLKTIGFNIEICVCKFSNQIKAQ